MPVKETIRNGARRAGLGKALGTVQSRWPSKTIRRDRRDNDHALVALCSRLAADSDAIDVGAHQGLFLSGIVRFAPHGSHMAFEPIPHMFEALRRDFPGVDVRNLALSDTKGETTFSYIPTMPGFSGFKNIAPGARAEELIVATDRLDDVIDRSCKPAVIKIDVEGAELQVLQGARETLARNRPMVLLEHGAGAAAYGTTHAQVFDELDGAGLRIFDFDGLGPMSRDEFAERSSTDRWNWLAR